ncbi:hypothetical protein GCM10025868_39780 [Angustibacter aerolatus]|uniref:Acetolactate synthase n=1 Tax=Angustibacter aerolatus TaxID=1162965 RepID=A0ABQ6JMY4_9ACTN|nr:hypothetical protein GCM10025868_39780 [Angustibacter aerolatus]
MTPSDVAGSVAARRTPAADQPVTGAQSLVLALEHQGVEVVFGIPGGAILPAYDPLLDSVSVRHVLVRHEQGAGHAAQGYAVATGRVGVCMATSGPGATNLVTPIADAYMDSVPIVAITGQVASASIGTDAFQEADIRGITMPITKHNYLVTDPADIPRVIAEAFHIAGTGRPGPVLVDISKDALQATTTFAWPEKVEPAGYHPVTRPHGKQVREAARLIAEAKRPVLYVGGGVIRAGASASLRALVDHTNIPVVTTLMGIGALPDTHPAHLGMPGMHGTVAAVTALQRSDLLISLGARFDDRVTGQAGDVRAARQGRARRHRPCRDLEEPHRRRADRRGRPRGAARACCPPSRPRRPRATAATTPPGGPRSTAGARRTRSATPTPATARSRRSTSSSGSEPSRPSTRSSPRAWGSTRCGRRSSSTTPSPTRGSTAAVSAPWASRCRRPWAPRPASPVARCGRSTATAASR